MPFNLHLLETINYFYKEAFIAQIRLLRNYATDIISYNSFSISNLSRFLYLYNYVLMLYRSCIGTSTIVDSAVN